MKQHSDTKTNPRRKLADAETREKFLGLLREGMSRTRAAAMVGCTKRTVLREVQEDEDFGAAVALAETEQEHAMFERMLAASEKSWQAAAWILERRFGYSKASTLVRRDERGQKLDEDQKPTKLRLSHTGGRELPAADAG